MESSHHFLACLEPINLRSVGRRCRAALINGLRSNAALPGVWVTRQTRKNKVHCHLLRFAVALMLCGAARQVVVGQNATSQTEPASVPLTTNANLYVSMEALDDTQRLGVGDRVSFRVIEDKE